MNRDRTPGDLERFVLVGVASTLALVVLCLLPRQAMSVQAANAVSLLVTAIPVCSSRSCPGRR
ncbi:MAG TPA: hypothetical protein VKH61_12575 [Streptosporangiaceae bacterium]|nr:hypothetical protein [Streptosporangiaceae bacterium]